MGESIFSDLVKAGSRNVTVRIVQVKKKKKKNYSIYYHFIFILLFQNQPDSGFPDNDTQYLSDHRLAKVRSINWKNFFNGSGVLHTKLFIVDKKRIFIVIILLINFNIN